VIVERDCWRLREAMELRRDSSEHAAQTRMLELVQKMFEVAPFHRECVFACVRACVCVCVLPNAFSLCRVVGDHYDATQAQNAIISEALERELANAIPTGH
jgi:hypothetical protein